MHKNSIPVVYATDQNYLFYTCVSITSLAENARVETTYHVFVLVASDFFDDENLLDSLNCKYSNIELTVVKVGEDCFTNIHIHNKHISRAAFFRLNVCQYIPEEKCIYLDSDTIVTEDLTELYDHDISEYYLAGCRDIWIDMLSAPELEHRRQATHIPDFRKYVNSGVLLFNLRKMRAEKIHEKLIEHAAFDYPYEDQDILNVCCYGHILRLPTKWNNFTAAVGRDREMISAGISSEIVSEFQKAEGIFHYITEEARPWNELRYWRNGYWWRFADKWSHAGIYDRIKKNVVLHDKQMQWDRCLETIDQFSEIVIWGYTKLAEDICDWILHSGNNCAICFCDSNPVKQGGQYRGSYVYSPDIVLENHKSALFIITSNKWKNEIEDILRNNGIPEEQWYIFSKKKDVSFYRMLDKQYYKSELSELFLKEGIHINSERMISEVKKHPEWEEKYNLKRWIFRDREVEEI